MFRLIAFTWIVSLFLSMLFPTVCIADETDYVVNTNWYIDPDTGVGEFRPGEGFDPDPGENRLPLCNDYEFEVTDDVGIERTELNSLLSIWDSYCQQENIDGVDVLNKITDLRPNLNRIQLVVNHVPLDKNGEPFKAMFSIFFPPYLQIGGDSCYPIVIQSPGYGGRGVNASLFEIAPMGLEIVRDAYVLNSEGVVFVKWNAGGKQCMSVNSNAREAMGKFIEELCGGYGCDKNSVVAIGGSRGGFCSLTLAENIAHKSYNYNVIGAFTSGIPLSIGTLSEKPIATNPTFASMYGSNAGPNTGRYTHVPPLGENPEVLRPAFGPDPADPGGNPTPKWANVNCPDYPANLDRLSGKYILISMGTHDSFFPLKHFIDMDNYLSNQGIEHTTVLGLQCGHSAPVGHIKLAIFEEFLYELLTDEDIDPAEFRPANYKHGLYDDARNYTLNTDLLTQKLSFESLHLKELPFSATFPYRLGCDVYGNGTPFEADEPGIIYLSGASGKDWKIHLATTVNPQGFDLAAGTFDGTEVATVEWWRDDFPIYANGAGDPFDPDNTWLKWTVFYDEQEVSQYTCWIVDGQRVELESEICDRQAWPAEGYVHSGHAENSGSTGNGIDYFPPLVAELTCLYESGTAPFENSFTITAANNSPYYRRLSYRVDVTKANGGFISNVWSGWSNVAPYSAKSEVRTLTIPNIPSVIGDNVFELHVLDITPPPYNQPPFPPDGGTDSDTCTVTVL